MNFAVLLIARLLAVPVTVATVGMSPEESVPIYTAALSLLPPGLVTVTDVSEATPPAGYYPNPLKRWRSALCESRGGLGKIILVLDSRPGINGMANICYQHRKCTVAYVSVDVRNIIDSAIAVAHELVHALGAFHLPGCNLMSSRAIFCRGYRVMPKTIEQVRACARG